MGRCEKSVSAQRVLFAGRSGDEDCVHGDASVGFDWYVALPAAPVNARCCPVMLAKLGNVANAYAR